MIYHEFRVPFNLAKKSGFDAYVRAVRQILRSARAASRVAPKYRRVYSFTETRGKRRYKVEYVFKYDKSGKKKKVILPRKSRYMTDEQKADIRAQREKIRRVRFRGLLRLSWTKMMIRTGFKNTSRGLGSLRTLYRDPAARHVLEAHTEVKHFDNKYSPEKMKYTYEGAITLRYTAANLTVGWNEILRRGRASFEAYNRKMEKQVKSAFNRAVRKVARRIPSGSRI